MIRAILRHPLGQAAVILVAAYLLFTLGIRFIPALLGIESAPVPKSIVLQYMLIAVIGVSVYVSGSEERWREFKQPLYSVLVDADKGPLRAALLVIVPIGVGWLTFNQTRPQVSAPAELRAIHPAPPPNITFRGQPMEITGLENPLRQTGSLEEHYEEGKRVYYQNCLPCHGDLLDGEGRFAHGFSPAPLAFTDPGTIAQLQESFVFWRVAKGGPGLPREATPWNSAMPAWEDFLTEDEIWAVIIFLYEQTGWPPRTWGGEGEGGHDE